MQTKLQVVLFCKVVMMLLLLGLLLPLSAGLKAKPARADEPFDPASYLPMPLPEWEPPRNVTATEEYLVKYNSETDQESLVAARPVSAHDIVEAGQLIGNPGVGAASVGEESLDILSFGSLSLIDNPTLDPWSRNVKLFMNFKDTGGNLRGYVCSGALIDPNWIVTAGHCVYAHTDDSNGWVFNDWADSVIVIPGYEDQNGVYDDTDRPYGVAREIDLYSFVGWIQNENFDYDLGFIQLDRPVGVLAGWLGYGYNSNNTFYSGRTFNNPGYPAESPYNGRFLYYWSGTYDNIGTYQFRHNNLSFGGQSGSGSYYIDSGNRFIHAVLSNGNSTTTGHVRVNQSKFESISDSVADNTPATIDLIPLDVNILPITLPAGHSLTSMNYVLTNYSKATWNGTVTLRVYLSTDRTITSLDTLLQTRTYNGSLGPKGYERIKAVSNLPIIPDDTLPGNYWLGIIADIADSNTGNNTTGVWDVATISINAFEPPLLKVFLPIVIK